MDPAPPVYRALDALGISYERHEHPAVFNADDASRHWNPIGGTQCKNLFLRNKKGDRHYLVVLEISKRADLKEIVKLVGDDRLSFGSPDRLMAELGLTPGSVSPFGLINDAAHSVRVVLDRDLKSAARLSFHPNINTVTFVVAAGDFTRFLESCGNIVQHVTV